MTREEVRNILYEVADEQKAIDVARAWEYIESIVEYTGLDSYYLKEEYMKAMEG